jgi:hypothetical protein
MDNTQSFYFLRRQKAKLNLLDGAQRRLGVREIDVRHGGCLCDGNRENGRARRKSRQPVVRGSSAMDRLRAWTRYQKPVENDFNRRKATR